MNDQEKLDDIFDDWDEVNEADEPEPDDPSESLYKRIASRDATVLGDVQAALQSDPGDPGLLMMAALAAIFAGRHELSLRYEHRFSKRYKSRGAEGPLLRALALAHAGRWAQASQVMKQHDRELLNLSSMYLPGGWSLMRWIQNWLNKIVREEKRRLAPPAPKRLT